VKLHTLRFPTEVRSMQHEAVGKNLSVVLVHGAGDHSGRYRHVVQALTQKGIAVVTGDLPGAGRTDGLRGHVDSFDHYLDAVDEWVEEAKRLTDGGPVVVVGHSLGGLITVRYLQERAHRHPQLIGAVLSSPALGVTVQVPGWKRALADVLDRLAPRLRMDSGLDASFVSRQPEVVSAYRSDPHCGGKVSVRWYQELTRAIRLAHEKSDAVRVPVLLMQAGQDKLVDPAASERFYETLSAGGKFVPYPDCYHELFNEPEQKDVFAEMVNWLEALPGN
jgi:lysophospholipase